MNALQTNALGIGIAFAGGLAGSTISRATDSTTGDVTGFLVGGAGVVGGIHVGMSGTANPLIGLVGGFAGNWLGSVVAGKLVDNPIDDARRAAQAASVKSHFQPTPNPFAGLRSPVDPSMFSAQPRWSAVPQGDPFTMPAQTPWTTPLPVYSYGPPAQARPIYGA